LKPIAVLIADDHQIVREGFRALLKDESDMEVVAEAENGRRAVEMTRRFRPDVVLMDIGMPVLNGLEATRQIRRNFPDTKVLVLSAFSDAAYVERVAALGGSGFLVKHTSGHVLATAIREIHRGKRFFNPAILRGLRAPSQKPLGRTFKKKRKHLSSREVEVLQLIAEGYPSKRVAVELGVAFKTVDKHRQHLMGKLNIHDIAGLTRYAIAEGIIESNVRLVIT
jgi:DNA-binding NarL/FixJ family response regulator